MIWLAAWLRSADEAESVGLVLMRYLVAPALSCCEYRGCHTHCILGRVVNTYSLFNFTFTPESLFLYITLSPSLVYFVFATSCTFYACYLLCSLISLF